TDLPHAVVDPARPETGLRDREPFPLAGDDVGDGNAHVPEHDPRVAAVGSVGVAEHVHAALDVDARGVLRHEDLRLLPVPVGVRVGLPHHDEDPAARVHRAGRPPLAAVDHVDVTVTDDAGGDVGSV